MGFFKYINNKRKTMGPLVKEEETLATENTEETQVI